MTAVSQKPSVPSALLTAYLTELAARPLRTKALTSGTLSCLQEITATKLSGMPASKNPDDYVFGINKRVVQMALYGNVSLYQQPTTLAFSFLKTPSSFIRFGLGPSVGGAHPCPHKRDWGTRKDLLGEIVSVG